MSDCGSSLTSAITSTRSYGATNSRMLTVIDTKMITHELQPTDTLQGLAIKYGVTVEKLKRVNKLWSNESILTKHFLLIPSETSDNDNGNKTSLKDSKKAAYIRPEILEDSFEETKKSKKSKCQSDGGSDGELGSSLKENECGYIKNETLNNFNDIMNNVDETIKEHKVSMDPENCSEAYKAFNAILSKIDGQIESHKSKTQGMAPDSGVPVVGYDSSYQNDSSGLFSPTRQHPSLEQGI